MGTGCWVCTAVAQQGYTWPYGGEHKGREGEIHPGAVTASSILLFYFLIIMTSFSALKPIMSEL